MAIYDIITLEELDYLSLVESQYYSDPLRTFKVANDMLKGDCLIPLEEMDSPIGLRVEGGGYIFYDDTVGFQGGTVTPSNISGSNISPNALANRWSITIDSNTYYEYAYDLLRGCVVRTNNTGTCNRFMVVDETDLVSVAYNSNLKWDTGSTSRSTSTAFGYGSANTTTLCSAITDTSCIWYTANFARFRNPQGVYNDTDSATDTRWFVPSRDELCVLNFMQYYDTTYRPTTGICSKRLQIPFRHWYWSSSQYNSSNAWYGDFVSGRMGGNYKDGTDYARLCRTF